MAYVLTSISGNLISAASAGYAPTNSADVSAIASAYATGKQDALTFGYDDNSAISSINGSGLAGGGATGDYVENSALEVAIGSANTSTYTGFAQGIANSSYLGGLTQGYKNTAKLDCIAQGTINKAESYSFAQGVSSTAARRSIAQGSACVAADDSLANGTKCTANSMGLAQGYKNNANEDSMAQGAMCTANIESFAQGYSAYASGISFAQGERISAINGMAAFGKNNFHINGSTSTGDSAAFVIGDGTSENARHDLMLVTKDGEITMYSSTADTVGTGIMSSIRAISAAATGGGVDSATVSAIASSYAESAVSGKQDALEFAYDADSAISSINGSALAGQGGGGGGGASITAVSYDTATQQSSIVTATGFGIVGSATNYPRVSSVQFTDGQTRHIEANTLAPGAAQTSIAYTLLFSPASSMWTTAGVAKGIYSPLQYGTGAGLFMDNGNFKGYLKGNELFVCNTGIGRAARLEVHQSRGSRLGLTGNNGSATVNLKESELTIVNSSYSTATLGRTKLVFQSPDSGTGTYAANYINLYDTAESAAKTISSTSIDYWNAKLDSSAIECDTASAITAIGGSAIAGGGGGVDSATVSAIASSYVESGVSSKLDTTAFNSGDFYTTANESGYVGSAYVDSAVSGKMDSSAMTSYALSADVSGTVDLVSTQSANWGGSALALSAGPGVKLEKVGDTLIAGLDETVLFSGSNSGMVATNLSEPLSSFNSFKICFNPYGAGMSREWKEFSWAASSDVYTVATFHKNGSDNLAWYAAFQPNTDGTTLTPITNKLWILGSTTVQDRTQMSVYRVVGINRTAEA